MTDENKADGAPLEIDPSFDELREECELLRGELAALYEEWENLNRVVIPLTQTKYMIKVGVLQLELLQTQVDVMRVRRRLGLLRSAIARGEAAAHEVIDFKIGREFQEWDDKIQIEASRIDDAKARFSSLVVFEDDDEIRSLYRRLARKLHPDINVDQGDEAKMLWPQVHSAYTWGDLFQMKAMSILADDYPESYDLPNDIGRIRHNRDSLKEKVKAMLAKVANLKQHPVFEWKKMLDDPEKLAAEQDRLRDEVHRARIQKTALSDMLHSLEARSV